MTVGREGQTPDPPHGPCRPTRLVRNSAMTVGREGQTPDTPHGPCRPTRLIEKQSSAATPAAQSPLERCCRIIIISRDESSTVLP